MAPRHQLAVVRQSVERNGGTGVEGADAGAPEFDDMAVAAERAAEVARNRAHIGAFAAFGLEHRRVGVGGHQRQADRR